MAVACGVVGVAVEFSDIKETVLSVQEGNAHGVFVRAGGEKPQSIYRGAVFGGVYFAAGIGKHAAAVGYVDIISVEGNSADMAGEWRAVCIAKGKALGLAAGFFVYYA